MKTVAISGNLRAAPSNTALARAAFASPLSGVETVLFGAVGTGSRDDSWCVIEDPICFDGAER